MSQPARILGLTLLALGLVALTLTLYWPATGNDFVWDDPIVFDQQLNAFRSARDVVKPPPKIPQFGSFYYRPTIVATYLLDQAVFGEGEREEGASGPARSTAQVEERKAFGFHLSVLLWHALATLLVFVLGLELSRDRDGAPGPVWPAALGAALFGLHPVHTESVVWMTGRSDTVAAVFVLGAMILHLRGRSGVGRPGWGRGALASFGLVLVALLAIQTLPGPEPGPGGWIWPGIFTGLLLLGGLAAGVLGWSRQWNPVVLYGPAAVLLLLAAGSKETALGMLLLLPVLPWALPLSRETSPAPAASSKGGKAGGRAGKRRARRKKGRDESRHERSSLRIDRAVSSFLVLAPYGLTLIVYLYFRSQALASTLAAVRGAGGPFAALRDLFTALVWYLRKMIWPEPLSAFVAGVPGGWWMTGLGVLGTVVAAGIFFLFLRRGFGREAVCLAIFFVFLLPPLGIVFKRVSETVLAERYLYLPSAGGCLLLAFLLARLGAWMSRTRIDRRAALALAVAPAVILGAFWTVSVVARIPDWANDLSFWADTADKAPDHGLPHLHYGMALSDELENAYVEAFALRRGKDRDASPPTPDEMSRAEELERSGAELDAKAEAEYRRAWETYDDKEGRYLTGNNMGNLFQGRGGRDIYRARSAGGEERDRLLRRAQVNFDLAIEQFTWSLANNPRYHKAHYNWARSETSLSNLAQYRGDVQDYTRHLEAIVPRYEAAIARNPRYFKAFRALAEFLYQKGFFAEAAARHDQAARWARTPAERQAALAGAARARQNLADGPASSSDRALRLLAEAERNRRAGRLFDATHGYWRALRLAPDLGRAYAGWGELYAIQITGERERGRAGRVLECLHRADTLTRTATEKAPGDPVVRLVRARILLQVGLPEEGLAEVDRILGFPSLEPAFLRQARDLQRRAASLDGNLPPERADRAAFFLRAGDEMVRQGQDAEAARLFWTADRRGSSGGEAALRLGRLLRRTAGKREDQDESHTARELNRVAAGHYARAAKASPGSFEAESGAGESYLASGKPILAVRHLAAAVPLAPDGEDGARVTRLYQEAVAEVRRYLPE